MAYPIDALLPDIIRHLAQSNQLVLQAAPGAGKTTRVPLALLHEPWLNGRKILMLEPRRLAARAAARFMAQSLNQAAGETVGYRVRLDHKVGAQTRIEVVTEGMLTRMLQNDPALEQIGLVIFDEFHERSLHADLGLALCLQAQHELREDLRLLVMSATLDGTAVAKLLRHANVIASEGRGFPVNIHYAPTRASAARDAFAFYQEVAQCIQSVAHEQNGGILVFLPGAAEIRQVEKHLEALQQPVLIAPLHGQLSSAAQDAAILPAPAGQRKIVLATSLAETSLTIEGIRIVIDAGLMRQPRFDPNTALTKLVTLPVSQAAADQRCGRAGRLQEGLCFRLWPQHQRLLAHSQPEILEADLAPLVLELAQWGVRDAGQLAWLDPPPTAHVAQAVELLQQLGALDTQGRITAAGRAMLDLGTHPRLAHMMLGGNAWGFGALACELAALCGERDPLRGEPSRQTDILLRVDALRDRERNRHGPLKSIHALAMQWQRQLNCPPPPQDHADLAHCGALLALAYPDRIAQRRTNVAKPMEGRERSRQGGGGRFLLSNGRGAFCSETDALAGEDYLVAIELDGAREARVFLAAALDVEDLLHYHGALIREHTFVDWDEREQCVRQRLQQKLGELALSDKTWTQADPLLVQASMLKGIRMAGPACLPWNAESRRLQNRLNFMHRLLPQDWPDRSDTALMASLENWLAPYLTGISRLSHLTQLNMQEILRAPLSWEQQRQLDEWAPTHITVPSGSHIPVDYTEHTPVLAVRVQEMFGLNATPHVGCGRVPLLLHLLSPAHRPVQVTQDLAGFWHGSYRDVKKDLKGRYPKHHWPEEPWSAQATARAKKRGERND